MSTDLRALLRDLAEGAPAIDNRIGLADRSYAEGRRRRTVRRFEVGAGSAIALVIVLVASLSTGSTPLAAQYGSSSGTSVSSYPSHVGHQFPVLGLPRKPGPAAGLMLTYSNQWYLLSPTGHRWSIPSPGAGVQMRPILSADGRMLAYPDSAGNFVVRDLVKGTSALFAGFSPTGEPMDGRYAIDYNLPGYFSPDDNQLALPGGVGGGGGGVVVLTIDTHRISAWNPTPYIGDFMAGWLDDSRLALIDRTTSPWLLDIRDVRGTKVGSTSLTAATPGESGGSEGWDELTADRTAADVVTGQTQALDWVISRYDLRTGALLTTFTLPQQVQNCARTDTPAGIVTSTWTSGGHIVVQSSTPKDTPRTVTTVRGALNPSCIEVTAAAAAGRARSPLLLDRLTDLVGTRWQWFGLAFLALGAGGLIARHRRRA